MTAILEDVNLDLVVDEPEELCAMEEVTVGEVKCDLPATHYLVAPCHRSPLCIQHAEEVRERIAARTWPVSPVLTCPRDGVRFLASVLYVIPKGAA